MHQYLSESFGSDALAAAEGSSAAPVVSHGGRDFFKSSSAGNLLRSFDKNDELVSEGTAERARKNLDAVSRREGSSSFKAWNRFLAIGADTPDLIMARGEDPDLVDETNFGKLTQDECEHYEASKRAARSVADQRQAEMRAFRQDKRKQGPTEDPLELLEWKAPREERGGTSSSSTAVRAVLGVKKRQRGKSDSPAVSVQAQSQAADLAEPPSEPTEPRAAERIDAPAADSAGLGAAPAAPVSSTNLLAAYDSDSSSSDP